MKENETSLDQPSPHKALLPQKLRSLSCLQPTCSIYYSFQLSLCYPFIENGHILSKCRFVDIIDIFLENGYWTAQGFRTAQGFQIERDLGRHLKANLRGEEAPLRQGAVFFCQLYGSAECGHQTKWLNLTNKEGYTHIHTILSNKMRTYSNVEINLLNQLILKQKFH